MNQFEPQFRTFCFPAALVEQIPTLIEQFGDEALDGNQSFNTIACGWDDSEHTRFRALRFPETASLTTLTDGRVAYTALWSLALLQAFKEGLFPDAQELTQEELQALLPVIEDPIIPTLSEENP
jgi:hypothetical protein